MNATKPMNPLALLARSAGPHRQRGLATLTIAVLALVVLLVITLFAIRMGLFEQRTSVNDHRAQVVDSVAEAALNQGTEFIKANSRFLLSTNNAPVGGVSGWLSTAAPRWQPCTTAVPAGMMDPCLSEPDATRRSQMYRFFFNGTTALPLADLMGADQVFDEVGGFPADYQVVVALCRIALTAGQPQCSLNPPSDSQVAMTLVAEAALPTEDAFARNRQIVASFRIIPDPPNVPLVAANTISGLGSAEIVPNPNAAGIGIPLSIWANDNVDLTGESGGVAAFQTCNLGEWLGNFNASGPTTYDGIQRCAGCSCNGLGPEDGMLSGKDPSNPSYEGPDILDVDGNTNGELPDSTYFPSEPLDDPNSNFDDSIFEYVLGGNTTNEGETSKRMDCVSEEVPSGDCEAQHLLNLGAEVHGTCAGLGSSTTGIHWVSGDCSLSAQVGTPSNPLLLVVDGCMSVGANFQFYGLVYQRATNCADLNNAFRATGGGQLYGALVVDAPISIAGSFQMIYNETVLNNLASSAAFRRYGVLPGSWSDEACFDTDRDCRE